MKKKILVAMLTATVMATVVTGCGTDASNLSTGGGSTVQAEQVVESDVSESLEESVSEVLSDLGASIDAESTTAPESTQAPDVTEAPQDKELPEETEAPKPTEAPEATEAPKPTETPEATETPVEEETKVEYTYTDMNKTMWAKSAVNVRNLPCTDGDKVGGLTSGEQVVVTGQCNETGWYRIGDGRYVSNSYLVSEKPQPQQTTPSDENNNQSGNTDASTTQGTATLLSSDFIGLLNAKRAEAGLSMVSLDGNLDATALAGVQELPNNYSHNVAGGGYDRCNIGKQYGMASASILFESWWNSEGHRAQMMDPYLTHIAVAYYSDGGYGIFIGNIDDDAYARDIAAQLNQGSSEVPTNPVNSSDVGGGQTIEVEGTPGAVTVVDPNEAQDLKDQWGW